MINSDRAPARSRLPARCVAALCVAVALAGCAPLNPQPRVRIDAGELEGIVAGDVVAFKGIPYAAPPVGELRWRPPQPVARWSGLRAATDYGPFCAQPEAAMLWFELDGISEDCLTLNVWTPRDRGDEKLPVMVWIHGGGYSQGTGNIPRLNSPAMARQGVVLVTINYRLHAFGFMVHPAIRAAHPDEPHGNYGLMDALTSLEWVQRNIAAFGGDPDNVTIFGESAGAGVVNLLLVMPPAEGFFHRAISQSSSVGIAPEVHIEQRVGFLPPGEKVASKFAERFGIEGDGPEVAAALRVLTTEELIAAMEPRDRFTPVVEGELLPDQVATLLAAGRQHAVPYMNGSVSWEASLGRQIGGGFSPAFAARLVPSADQARLYPGLAGEALEDEIFGDLIVRSGATNIADHMQRAGAPVYSFYFSYLASDRRDRQPGVAHADDIAFVMQTLDTERDLEKISARDREISALMSAYWVQFAKTGNPNAPGLPKWPAWSADGRRVLEIGDEIVVHENFLGERMAYHLERGKAMLVERRAPRKD